MRDNNWLKNKLELIWNQYFPDIRCANEVRIEFGRKARTRLGSIRLVRSKGYRVGINKIKSSNSQLPTPNSQITITGYFQDERVPEWMIDAVIAHELCHYAHGFSSPLPQLFKCPHQGGAVDHELIKRGLGDILIAQRKWLRETWPGFVNPKSKTRKSKQIRRYKSQTVSIFKLLGF